MVGGTYIVDYGTILVCLDREHVLPTLEDSNFL